MSITITSDKLLAVEGKDEVFFFKALLKFLSLENIQIIDIGGNEKFKNQFAALSIMDNFENIKMLGIVRDAEQRNASAAHSSISGVLKKYSFPVPGKDEQIIAGSPKVGIYIMPNNNDSGMLESLCFDSLKDNEISNCIDTYFQCIKSNYEEEYSRLNLPKAKILAYLSSRAPIVNSLGLGAQKKYFDFNNPTFEPIISFIQKLFN